jgi:hypothetical protein
LETTVLNQGLYLFAKKFEKSSRIGKMENEAAAKLLEIMERPIGIEPTPEPWQGSVLPLY